MIEFKHLSKSFDQHQVLNNINFNWSPGSVTGIVGKNGAGKTTLFRCIAGLQTYSGEIVSDFSKLKDHIGYLPTSPYFIDRLTGAEYLTLVLKARSLPVGNLALKNIFDLPLDTYASTYSTGMKKKLALLGMLLQQNEVFILDEPFNGVDIEGNMLISSIIKELKAEGKYILLSSHLFASLKNLCDSLLVLEHGQLSSPISPSEFEQLEKTLAPTAIGNILDKLHT